MGHIGGLVLACGRFTEHDVEPAGAKRAERGGRGEAQVDLEAVGQQEGPVDGRAAAQVEVVQRAELAVDECAPVLQGVVHVGVCSHTEEQVDVGPAVLGALRRRAC